MLLKNKKIVIFGLANKYSIAAGIVYFVSFITNTNISKKNIHDITEISEVTINKCYKKMYAIRHNIVPSSILKKYNHS